MPKFILLLLLAFSLTSTAQNNIEIFLNNPIPRVGEEVEILFSKNFTNPPKNIHGRQETMTLHWLAFEEAREYTVGPFEFNFDGKTYKTNSIQVKVEEALPVQEGIWLRWYEERGQIILVVEQLIPLERKITTTLEGVSSSYEKTREPAIIMDNPQAGINFFNKHGSSRGVAKDNSHRGPHYTYHLHKYIVSMDASMKKGFKILPKHFYQFKKGLPYTPITIPYLKKS